jgi:hypothetical protein
MKVEAFMLLFIKPITNTSALFCFSPYVATSSTILANMQELFPLADPIKP